MPVLDRRITIKKPAPGQNVIGDPQHYATGTFATVAQVWARRVAARTVTGAERRNQAGVHVVAPHTYLIRYRSDVTPDMIFIDGAATYRITQVVPVGRKAYLELEAEWLDGAV